MRADIHEGPEHMLQSEAGYIDARPHRQDRRNLLHRTAGPYIGSKPASLRVNRESTSATCGLMHRSKDRLYSSTLSARTRKDSGMVRPRALAALRLITSS